MSKKAQKLPTEAELAFYRSKSVDGSYIGKNQLAAVFAALDAETARADFADNQIRELAVAAQAHLEMFETVSSGIQWGKTFLSADAITRMNEAPLALRKALASVGVEIQ